MQTSSTAVGYMAGPNLILLVTWILDEWEASDDETFLSLAETVRRFRQNFVKETATLISKLLGNISSQDSDLSSLPCPALLTAAGWQAHRRPSVLSTAQLGGGRDRNIRLTQRSILHIQRP